MFISHYKHKCFCTFEEASRCGDGMSPTIGFYNGSEHVSENMTKHDIWMSENVQKRQANCDIGAFRISTDRPTCRQPLVFTMVGDTWDDL